MLRFAPSPTGDIHIGNLRAAIFNYILAKQLGQKFLIRIEDTDIARNIDGKDKEILGILNLFGLLWDQLVYQSDNFNHHRILANELVAKGKAFLCYCTKEFLEAKRLEAIEAKLPFRYKDEWAEFCKNENPTPSIRLRGSSSEVSFIDEIKGECRFSANELDSFVIMRDDGVPTYNFACSVDDMIYDISFIVRGEDHVSNTPKQILVHKALGYTKSIKYAHLPIILNDSGKKMSKRESESSVKWLLEQGYLPQAIANYLILMGNKPKEEIFTIKEAIEWFDLSRVSKSPVRFDINQLRYINREHLKRLNQKDMAFLLESDDLTIGEIGKIYLQESSTLNELRSKVELIFSPKKIDEQYEAQMRSISSCILGLLESGDSSINEFESLKIKLIENTKLNGKALFYPLRILLTGSPKGPLLTEIYPYLKFYLSDIVKLEKQG